MSKILGAWTATRESFDLLKGKTKYYLSIATIQETIEGTSLDNFIFVLRINTNGTHFLAGA